MIDTITWRGAAPDEVTYADIGSYTVLAQRGEDASYGWAILLRGCGELRSEHDAYASMDLARHAAIEQLAVVMREQSGNDPQVRRMARGTFRDGGVTAAIGAVTAAAGALFVWTKVDGLLSQGMGGALALTLMVMGLMIPYSVARDWVADRYEIFRGHLLRPRTWIISRWYAPGKYVTHRGELMIVIDWFGPDSDTWIKVTQATIHEGPPTCMVRLPELDPLPPVGQSANTSDNNAQELSDERR